MAEKIRKQALHLQHWKREEADLLYQYINEIEFGDVTNREGHAAKVYFNALFGMDFTRSAENVTNAALNYGYSLLLSTFNRCVVANGYITQLGLFHDNVFNQFNLACNLMEPFRPLVDLKVKKMKNVLCEKAFSVNADQARKLFALAKEKNLLITEAIWTRYMPSRKMINEIIESGVIGEVTSVTANLNYTISNVERIRKPELAGGALLDVGVYPINFASMVLGDKLKDVQATAIFKDGVDILDTIAMVFEGDRMATLQCGAREISDRVGSIFGTKGFIQVQNINNPEKITVFDL